jgi:pimeloyl-ACP methyl ester carboxylesterase
MRAAWLTAVRAAAVGLVVLLLMFMVVGRVVYRPRLPADISAFTETNVERGEAAAEGQRHLIVVFRGMGGRPLDDVRAVVKETFPAADLMIPRYSSSGLSNEDPLDIVQMYLRAIDDAVERGRYNRITLVGYSMGALIARKMLVCAHTGCAQDYDRAIAQREWRVSIDRLVLLAGMNRGWATHCEKVVAVQQAHGVGYDNDCRANRMTWAQWIQAEWGQRFGPMFGVGRMILAVQRGQPFVANLRLQWLDLQGREKTLPPVVQLLGNIDELVSKDDNLDQFVTRDNFAFIQLETTPTDHSNVVEMRGPQGSERKTGFVRALTWPIDQIRSTYTQPPRTKGFEPDPTVKRVVVILHGIRDDGRWAKDLGAVFEKTDRSLKTYSRSYGYFAALYFLTPTRMEANVRWFVDQYTELKALYPNATFDFVGHSNGTYILSQAVARYYTVSFNRVVFAGSVVQRGFPWSNFKDRVGAIRNYRASEDFVVAALPSFFEHIQAYLRDVGSAGHAGFDDDFAKQSESKYFAVGGHGAVLGDKNNYPALVSYVLAERNCAGVECEAYELPTRAEQQWWLANLVYRFSVLLWLLTIIAIGWLAYKASRLVRGERRHSTLGYWVRRTVAGAAVVGLVLAVLRYV